MKIMNKIKKTPLKAFCINDHQNKNGDRKLIANMFRAKMNEL